MIDFKEKVQSMTAKEIIMAMVNGLKAEHVKVDMNTFGEAWAGVCYGCAATNAICEISGVVLKAKHIDEREDRAKAVASDKKFLESFEYAIDELRIGSVIGYNVHAQRAGFQQIRNHYMELPYLDNGNYKNDLDAYIALAEAQ